MARTYLLGIPLAYTDVERFALANNVCKSLHGFFERGFDVIAMSLVEIDIVGLQSLERAID